MTAAGASAPTPASPPRAAADNGPAHRGLSSDRCASASGPRQPSAAHAPPPVGAARIAAPPRDQHASTTAAGASAPTPASPPRAAPDNGPAHRGPSSNRCASASAPRQPSAAHAPPPVGAARSAEIRAYCLSPTMSTTTLAHRPHAHAGAQRDEVQVLVLNAVLLRIRPAAVVRNQRQRRTGGRVGSGLTHGGYREIEVTNADVAARAGGRYERTGRAHARPGHLIELGATSPAEAGDRKGFRRLKGLNQRVGRVGQVRRKCQRAADRQVRDLDRRPRTARHPVSRGDGVVRTRGAQTPGSRNVPAAGLYFAAAIPAPAT